MKNDETRCWRLGMRSPSDTLIRVIIIVPDLLVSIKKRIPQMEFYFSTDNDDESSEYLKTVILEYDMKLSIKSKINMV